MRTEWDSDSVRTYVVRFRTTRHRDDPLDEGSAVSCRSNRTYRQVRVLYDAVRYTPPSVSQNW